MKYSSNCSSEQASLRGSAARTSLRLRAAGLLLLLGVIFLAMFTAPASAFAKSYGQGLTGSYRGGIPFSRWKSISEYTTETMRANFRSVKGGSMGTRVLFRSRTPLSGNETGKIADLLLEDAGVRYIINLEDSKSKLSSKMNDSFYSGYRYRTLYRGGFVSALAAKMTFGTRSERLANRKAMIASFKAIAANPGPYLVHCAVGKDRTGEFCMIAGALMGADYDELLDDYITSHLNFGAGSTRAKALSFAKSNLDYMLQLMTYEPSGSNWQRMNLAKKAETYLKDGGLTAKQVKAVKKNLSKDYPALAHVSKGRYMLTVTFRDGLTGKVISRRKVQYGRNVSFPKAPSHSGYTFSGWSSEGKKIKKDVTIRALFVRDVTEQYGTGLKGKYVSGMPFSRWKTAAEYDTSAMLGNFRSVKGGRIGANVLFRSKIPDGEKGSSRVADLMMQDAGVKYVINFYETETDLAAKLSQPVYSNYYYKTLYESGRVTAARTLMDFSTAKKARNNRSQMIRGFKTIADHAGPYLVHCAAGKDRTGEFCMIAGALMGASYNELLTDYMESFLNYGYQSSVSGAMSFCRKNLDFLLQVMTYSPSGSDWASMDLSAKAERYLKDGGLTAAQISRIKKNLAASYPGMTRTKNGNYYCTVTFRNGVTGQNIGSVQVVFGGHADLPSEPEMEGYVFTGWDSGGKNIKGDIVITAKFREAA